jgi:hypothetical protein
MDTTTNFLVMDGNLGSAARKPLVLALFWWIPAMAAAVVVLGRLF